MNTEILILLLAALGLYQLFVTFRILMSGQYSIPQRFAQLALIWFIPFFGALVCNIFLESDGRPLKTPESGFTPDGGDNPPGTGSDGIHH